MEELVIQHAGRILGEKTEEDFVGWGGGGMHAF